MLQTTLSTWALTLLCVLSPPGSPISVPRRLGQRRQRRQRRPPIPLPELSERDGRLISRGPGYANQPALAETTDGTLWLAYVQHHQGTADEVVAVSVKDGAIGAEQVLSAKPGQYIRPALTAHGNEVWCVWTASEPEHVASIWYSRRTRGRWSPAGRLLPGERRAHQNPEIARAADGRIAIAYQLHTGSSYDIHLEVWTGEEWSAPRPLSDASSDDWDPALAFDARGVLHVVWSGFQDGDYDVYWKRLPDASPRRISARGEYDLHPWLQAAPDGAVWASWDVVRIPGHASSGPTTITGANSGFDIDSSGRRGARSWVEVKVLDGRTLRVPGDPRSEIVAPRGYLLAHNGLAKVAIGKGGEPWIFYRVLRRDGNPWLPRGGIGYYWDLLGRPFQGGKWQEPRRFSRSDGYLEEAAPWATGRGIYVAYGGERRKQSRARATSAGRQAAAQARDAGNHHHDFDGVPGCNGDVRLATIGDPATPGPALASLPETPPFDDRQVLERNRAEPYQVKVGDREYRLLWGDTHRHSNISRCSAGAEPSPDDLYRYGTDICRYDFFALSDHAEHHKLSADDAGHYYWWLQQKLADLYHIPGIMSVLYNFEWTLAYPHGHHNTVFPSRPTVRLARNMAATSTLQAGWKVLERSGLKAITIPHTGASRRMGTAWAVQDDRYQRLCEIFQACRGSYEHAGCPREFRETGNKTGFYWKALEKGYHVGVIASSDHGYGVSYACVYAPENTREAVWQAMWDRRTYGSTTYGLVLDVRSGEHWMGEEWTAKEAPLLEIYVRGGDSRIRSVEVLGRSRVLYAEGSFEQPLGRNEHRIRWSDPEWEKQTMEQWYYVRVIRTDDEMAWSSPVWVKPSEN